MVKMVEESVQQTGMMLPDLVGLSQLYLELQSFLILYIEKK